MPIAVLKAFIAAPIFFIAGIFTYFLMKTLFVYMLNSGGVNTATWHPLVLWMMPLMPIFCLGLMIWWAFVHVSRAARRRQ